MDKNFLGSLKYCLVLHNIQDRFVVQYELVCKAYLVPADILAFYQWPVTMIQRMICDKCTLVLLPRLYP